VSTLYDNLTIDATISGDSLSDSSWYSYVDSSGVCQATYKGSNATHTASSDAHILLTTINADTDSKSSPEADSYITDSSGRTFHAFIVDGADTLSYSTTNILKSNKGSIVFIWKAPLPYNKFTSNGYLFEASNLIRIYYKYTDYKFYFEMYNGSDWATVQLSSDAKTFGTNDWLKICATWDISSGTTAALYVNSSTADDIYSSVWTEQTVPATMYIGSTASGTNQSDGAFDEFRIYSEQLTSTKVNTLFNTVWSGL